MNIFASFKCPHRSAQFLDDSRVVKMVVESAQMLSTALRFSGCSAQTLYRVTHANHGCNVWVRGNRSHYLWLVDHYEALCLEYLYRFDKFHVTHLMLPPEYFRKHGNRLPEGKLRRFANHARHSGLELDFTHLPVHDAYQAYLFARWEQQVKPCRCTLLLDKYAFL